MERTKHAILWIKGKTTRRKQVFKKKKKVTENWVSAGEHFQTNNTTNQFRHDLHFNCAYTYYWHTQYKREWNVGGIDNRKMNMRLEPTINMWTRKCDDCTKPGRCFKIFFLCIISIHYFYSSQDNMYELLGDTNSFAMRTMYVRLRVPLLFYLYAVKKKNIYFLHFIIISDQFIGKWSWSWSSNEDFRLCYAVRSERSFDKAEEQLNLKVNCRASDWGDVYWPFRTKIFLTKTIENVKHNDIITFVFAHSINVTGAHNWAISHKVSAVD